jgi:hypothetical protein
VPYRIYPLNLTSGDSIPRTGWALQLGYENPGSGDPPDGIITTTCRNTSNHPAHSDSTQVSQGTGSLDMPLEHDGAYAGVIVRGVISSMDPFQQQDVFEVSNITVYDNDPPPFEIAQAKPYGRHKMPVLPVEKGKDAKIVLLYKRKDHEKLKGAQIYVFVQSVGRHGVPTINWVSPFPFKPELEVLLPARLWDAPSRLNFRAALVNAAAITFAVTVPIHFGPL